MHSCCVQALSQPGDTSVLGRLLQGLVCSMGRRQALLCSYTLPLLLDWLWDPSH